MPTLNNRCRIIVGTQKGTIISRTTHLHSVCFHGTQQPSAIQLLQTGPSDGKNAATLHVLRCTVLAGTDWHTFVAEVRFKAEACEITRFGGWCLQGKDGFNHPSTPTSHPNVSCSRLRLRFRKDDPPTSTLQGFFDSKSIVSVRLRK